eukprot:Em0018g378a
MATRFNVADVTLETIRDGEQQNGELTTPNRPSAPDIPGSEENANVAKNQITITSESNFALYEDDFEQKQRVPAFLSSMVQHNAPSASPKKEKQKKSPKLGTVMGVYLPCVQNIIGVILFIRLPWAVGEAGVGECFLIMFICCLCAFLTTISLSAIATNGVVPAGGPYFLISRNLGPEFGGSAGLVFYFGNTFAAALYMLGSIELLVVYIAPQMAIFEPLTDPDVLYNNMRVYGTILLILTAIIVFFGVKFISIVGVVSMVMVLLACLAIYAGAFDPRPRVQICTLDGVALEGQISCSSYNYSDVSEVYQNITKRYCHPSDPYLRQVFNGTTYMKNGEWLIEPMCKIGVPGLMATNTINENAASMYLKEGEAKPGQQGQGIQVTANVDADFFVLVGILFNAVTGIMAGSSRSGDLKDAQKSIPTGTILATLTTSMLSLTCVLIFGGTVSRFYLQDQLGSSVGLPVALMAWPSKWVILIGAFVASTVAGLQSLASAPKLLQAIANDHLIPILNYFGRPGFNGEPTFALLLTVCLAEVGVLIASVDSVAPISTMFFLILDLLVHVACTLQSFLKAPNWRPRFHYYHWTVSLFGALLCIVLMFFSGWYYALSALAVTLLVYKYIEYRGAEKEWGDGIRGLSLQAARYSLLKLEETPPHTKNWRPQVLVLCKLDRNFIPAQPKILSFISQLKAGKGLALIYSVLEGIYTNNVAETSAAKMSLKRFSDENKIDGFCTVVAAPNVATTLPIIVQGAGLGGMRHNTVVILWPDSWKTKDTWELFVGIIRVASCAQLAVLVPKGIDWFPSKKDKMKGNIDVWWVVHDGGLLMLLPFLLKQHKVWKHCTLRIFTVAEPTDNSIQIKKDLENFMYQLRLEAVVSVVELTDSDISAYTYERTLVMEQRNYFLQRLNLNRKERSREMGLIRRPSVIPAHEEVMDTEDPSVQAIRMSELQTGETVTTPAEFPNHQELDTTLTKPMEGNVRRMNTSVKLNKMIKKTSTDAALVIVNLPSPPKNKNDEKNYMEFLDVLTEGLPRVLLVRGGGREVITIFS